jgi:drug/metabolite transporter (DMT)-like permease/uncharacterized metal-binding protein YceD (DUF177 family)
MGGERPGLPVWSALAAVYLIWGSTYLGIRLAVETIPPLLMLSVRFLVAGGLLYAFAVRRGDRGGDSPRLRQWLAAGLIGAALLGFSNGSVAWAEQGRVRIGTAALLIASVPLWLALLDRVIYGERLRLQAVVGLAVGFAGVGVLAAGGGAHGDDPFGSLVLVAGSLVWAIGSLYSRHAPLPRRPLVGTAMEMLAGGLVLAVAGVARGELGELHLRAVSARSLAGLVYLVFVGSLIGFSAYTWLLRNARTSLVGTYAYVNPVVAVLLGAVFLSEPLTPRMLVAGAAIVLAVALILRARAVREPVEPIATLDDVTSFNLRTVKLRSGEQYRDEQEIELSALELGGQRYLPVPEKVAAELTVSRATTGTLFELAFDVRLHGPCYRCLGDAVLDLPIRAQEYQATSPGPSDELRTPYLVDDRLDLSAWARDAIALALPDKILCRADCAGLCPVCGADLNGDPHAHEEEPADSRWAALAELRDQL